MLLVTARSERYRSGIEGVDELHLHLARTVPGACDIVGIHARSKAHRLGGGATLDYNRRESASDSRCMHAFSGQGARLPEWEVSGADTTGHHILGLPRRVILVTNTKTLLSPLHRDISTTRQAIKKLSGPLQSYGDSAQNSLLKNPMRHQIANPNPTGIPPWNPTPLFLIAAYRPHQTKWNPRWDSTRPLG